MKAAAHYKQHNENLINIKIHVVIREWYDFLCVKPFIDVRFVVQFLCEKQDEYTGLRLRVHRVVQMVRGGQWGIERSISLLDQSQGQVVVVAMFKVHRDSDGLSLAVHSGPSTPWDFRGHPTLTPLPCGPLSDYLTIEPATLETRDWVQPHQHRVKTTARHCT